MQLTKIFDAQKPWYEVDLNGGVYNIIFNLVDLKVKDLNHCIQQTLLEHNKKSQHQQLAVFFSGGMDSALIVHHAKQLNLDFVAVTVRYCDGLNNHDVIKATAVCEQLGVEQIFVDLTPFEMTEYGLTRGFTEHCAFSWSSNHLMYACEKLGNQFYYIAGEGDPRVFVHKGICKQSLLPEWHYVIQRFCKNTDINFVYQFYQSNQDIWYSYHRHAAVLHASENPHTMQPDFGTPGKEKIFGNKYSAEKATGFEKWTPLSYPDAETDHKIMDLKKQFIPLPRENYWISYHKFWDWIHNSQSFKTQVDELK